MWHWFARALWAHWRPFLWDRVRLHTYIVFYFLEIIIILQYYDSVYIYRCLLSSGHWWKPRATELCLYKLQNALIQGPAQWGIRGLFEMLSVVFILVSLSVLELQPGDQMRSNTWIALKSYHWSVFVPRLSWSDQQVLGKKNTPCVIIKNELALMSFCFVTRGCWNTWWQLALCKLNGNACSILYDHRDIKYHHGNYTQ